LVLLSALLGSDGPVAARRERQKSARRSQSDAYRKSGAIHYAVTAREKAETQLLDLAQLLPQLPGKKAAPSGTKKAYV
jgi:hypothetical protein